jgi:hypothetical protein
VQKWEFAEARWHITYSAQPGRETDEAEGSVEFSGQEESIEFGEGELWDTLHQLGQEGWELVTSYVSRTEVAMGAMMTTSYTFKRPAV